MAAPDGHTRSAGRHVGADGSVSAVREDVATFFHTYELVSRAGGGYARLGRTIRTG
jgi:hypothetical protein